MLSQEAGGWRQAMTSSKNILQSKYFLPALVFLLAFVLGNYIAHLLYRFTYENERSEYYQVESNNAQIFIEEIQSSVDRHYMRLASVAGLFAASDWVSDTEFKQFINTLYHYFPENRRITYIMRIPQQDRLAIEKKITENNSEDYKEFRLFGFSNGSREKPIPVNNHYLSVAYTFAGDNSLSSEIDNFIGRVINKGSRIYPSISNAIRTNRPHNSGIVQPIKGIHDKPFFIMVYPVKKSSDIIGYVFSSIQVEDLIASATKRLNINSFDIEFTDQFSGGFKTLSSADSVGNSRVVNRMYSSNVDLPGTQWQAILRPSENTEKFHSNSARIVLLVSIVVALSVSAFIASLVRRRQFLTAEVESRTADLKKTSDELQDKSNRIDLLINATNVGVFDWDIQNHITHVNEQWARMLGYTVKEITPLDLNFWKRVSHPGEKENTDKVLAAHIAGETPIYETEFRLRHKDGHWVWLLSKGKVVEWDENHKPLRLVGINQDITQRKQDEFDLIATTEAAQAAAKAKSEFLANMSHEIRTPLNGIIGMTELCRRTELTPKQSDYLKKVDISAKHLASVINDILDFSKIDSGMLELDRQPFSIYTVIDNLKASVEHIAHEKNLGFSIELSDRVHPDLYGDSLRIGQVLLNLCSNAIKFTDQGDISVFIDCQPINKMEPDSSYLYTMSVKDTGIGIAADKIESLFDDFTQADASTTRKYGGTGLGLSISKKLCEIMGGELTASSQEGYGSTFIASMTLDVNNKVISPTSRPLNFDSPIKILVVEDNLIANQILTEHLSAMGATVITAHSVREGFFKLETHKDIDFIILDWKMPQQGADTFLYELTNSPEQPSLPQIIILSGYDKREIARQTNPAIVKAILSKPCKAEELFETIIASALHGHSNALATNSSAAKANQPSKPLAGLSILAAEDNRLNQEILLENLTEDGAQVIICDNGLQCIEHLKSSDSPDVLLMDIHMPEMDGIEATRVIRNELKLNHLPIIALTANVMKSDIDNYLTNGMDHHIGKPFDPDELVDVILSATTTH